MSASMSEGASRRVSQPVSGFRRDVSVHDAETNWEPRALPVLSAEEVQGYVGSLGERCTYRDGRLVHPGSVSRKAPP